MSSASIAHERLHRHALVASSCTQPDEVVRHLVAMQAQDYGSALWAVGVRMPTATESTVEQALRDGKIVRTWPLRGTLHFVAAEDVRWLLALLTAYVLARGARRHQQLELTEDDFARARSLFVAALQGGGCLTRREMMAVLERGGIATTGQRGYHILGRVALEGVICFGPRTGKEDTFVLLDEWVPEGKSLSYEEALAELARRYVASHGPATLHDFMWWSGLPAVDARTALELAGPHLSQEAVGKQVYWSAPTAPDTGLASPHALLLPAFDEYLLGYRYRDDVLDPPHATKIVPGGNGIFKPIVVVDGRVVGTWKRTLHKTTVAISLDPFEPLSQDALQVVAVAADAYGDFLGLPVDLHYS